MMRAIILQFLLVCITVGAAFWLWKQPDYEPFLAVLGGVAAIVGSDWWNQMSRKERKSSILMEEAINDYERIRKQEGASTTRAARMTACVKRMILASDGLKVPVNDWIGDSRDGRRLAAYVYLFCKPDPKYFTALLTQACLHERTPFNIYWGLQAVRQCLGEHNFDSRRSKLSELLQKIDTRLTEQKEMIGGGSDIRFLIKQLQRIAANPSKAWYQE